MTKENNLNELLNTDIINENENSTTLVKKQKVAATAATEPVPVAVPATPVQPLGYISLFDFIVANKTKITNGASASLTGFGRVPAGKYLLFCTTGENADLILFERPNTLWIENNVMPDTIKVEESGIVIKCSNARYYVGKNNVTKISIQDNKVVSMSTISRSKTSTDVKVSNEEVAITSPDAETIKLHVKRISPRLYNAVKDCSTREEIKTNIITFMEKILDLNHLIKIEKELLLSLSL